MTPSKEKKPLPPLSSSNTTVVVLDQPITYLQWHTALQQVKIIYLNRQYKQCASRCTQLLSTAPIERIHPLHPPFLHFYTALSHEAVARSTHNLSATKPRTLQLARESYEAAAASLPRPATLAVTAKDDENDDYEEEEDANSSTRSFSDTASSYSVTSSHTPNDDDDDDNERPTSPHPTTQPPPPRRPASPAPSPPSTTSTAALRPSPLRIRKKAVHFPPTPPRSHPSPPPSFPHRPNPSTASYNTHLISFATTLQTRIHAVDALLHRTDVAQQHGRRGAGGDGEAEGREARIERLRAGGWRRERFVAGRYEEVCARALAEL